MIFNSVKTIIYWITWVPLTRLMLDFRKCDQRFHVLYSICVTNMFLKLHLPKWSICTKYRFNKNSLKIVFINSMKFWVKHYGVCDLCGKKCKFLHQISLKSLSLEINSTFGGNNVCPSEIDKSHTDWAEV